MKDGRQTVIDQVTQAVMSDRNRDYAPPEDNFARIADLWSTYLDTEITPYDTAIMMVLLKVARAMHSPHLLDHLVDGAGYFACAADVLPIEDEWAPHYRDVAEPADLGPVNPYATDGGLPGDVLASYEGMPGFIRDDMWHGAEGRKVVIVNQEALRKSGALVLEQA